MSKTEKYVFNGPYPACGHRLNPDAVCDGVLLPVTYLADGGSMFAEAVVGIAWICSRCGRKIES